VPEFTPASYLLRVIAVHSLPHIAADTKTVLSDIQSSLLLIGAGRMGGALLQGWLSCGLNPDLLYVDDPALSPQTAAALTGRKAPTFAGPADIVVIAVKPQALDALRPRLQQVVGTDTLIISILAGKTLARIADGLPAKSAIVRAMPNTPASIGRGMTVMVANAHTTLRQRELASTLLRAVGEVAWIDDEDQMDAVTAVSGSGPAYVFLLAEALALAGEKAGLSPDLAIQLARSTVSGAGELLHQSEEKAALLRQNVTSPGGTTAAALGILMADNGLQDLLNRAVEAAAVRSRQLAE
jgi:pyrroline-5-carboxylate reductase